MFFIFLILALITLKSYSQPAEPLYYGAKSGEAIMQFEYFVETTAPAEETMATILIDKQLTYLFGALSANVSSAVPKVDHKINVLRTEKVNDLYRIYYQYQGTVVVKQNARTVLSFPLPRNPQTIFAKSVVRGRDNVADFRCNTDKQHLEERYFWYFWNPQLGGCPMINGLDYDLIHANLTWKQNTKISYPEYSRLIEAGNIRIDILMGLNDSSLDHDPFKSRDVAADNFRRLHKQLIKVGYQPKVWNLEEIRKIAPTAKENDVFVETLVKTTANAKIEIRFFFGGTSYFGENAFQYFMKDSIENANVYIYAGHSGLGENLDVEKIERRNNFQIQFNPNKYQIFFFNGCSSYPYYNSSYFAKKSGSRNLDILTNGLATFFSAINPSTYALIQAIDIYASTGKRQSYQEIIKLGDSNNLLGINGDEDNP